jgi:nitrous oxidase accessory protein NosD
VRKVPGLSAGTALCALLALAAWPATAPAAQLGCGDRVTHDTVLTADVTGCGAAGLVVGADGVTLDLGGHTVAGNRLGFGVAVAGRRAVTIRNGTVSGFRVGVDATDSSDVTVRDVAVVGGHDGVNFFRVAHGTIEASAFTGNDASAIFPEDSTDLRVLDNRAWDNAAGFTALGVAGGLVAGNAVRGQTYYGLIFLDVTGLVFSDNRFEQNGTLGMQIGGDSAGNHVSRNRAWRNGADGILVDAPGTTLTRNSAFFNGNFGIEAGRGVLDGGGNIAKHNGAGAQCAGIACR